MTNSTSTDVTFEGAWWNRVIAKQTDFHSTAPADKQINEQRYTNSLRSFRIDSMKSYILLVSYLM